MKDPVTQKSVLVIDALQYAHENIDEFTELLKTSDTFMDMTAKGKKSNLPN
jgi:hypothetical protein